LNFKFEKLIIWQKSIDFGENIFALSSNFPANEMYNLTSQIRRAADSIALNIAEGSIGQSNPEQKKFVGYSIRSLAEVVTCLVKAYKREYISEADYKINYAESYNLMNMLNAFKNGIR